MKIIGLEPQWKDNIRFNRWRQEKNFSRFPYWTVQEFVQSRSGRVDMLLSKERKAERIFYLAACLLLAGLLAFMGGLFWLLMDGYRWPQICLSLALLSTWIVIVWVGYSMVWKGKE